MKKKGENKKSKSKFLLRATCYGSRDVRGQLSLQILVLGFVASVVLTGFLLWADAYVRNVKREGGNSLAFTIAEAGIEYYRWHLAHSPQDFTDGATSSPPYVHIYYDKDNNRLGQFELEITAPATGTTIAAIRSTGKIDADPNVKKIIEVQMGLPSLARYSVVANADIRFGAGTEVYGQLHSNGGIRFDGVAYNIVTSAKEQYNDPDHSGNNEFGVHTHVSPVDPAPGNAVPVRTDVFKTGREFPVPAVDFTGITQDLADIKEAASSSGYYYGASGASGWHLVLKTNDNYDLYKVNSLVSYSGCNSNGQSGWGTWSIKTETFYASKTIPNNSVIFFEDHVWVDGKIDGQRLTIAAGRFPDNPAFRKNIIVAKDLLYTSYDGTDVIGLIAQENLNIALESEDDLRIDAAVVAQNGRVGRHYYTKTKCGSGVNRSKITMHGMLASNARYGFAYTDGTGYQDRILGYDGNLLYGPPPYFPITAAQYDIISWEEVK